MAEIPVKCTMAFIYVLRPSGTGHEVLLLKRTQTLAGEWCQVSGRIDEGEMPWQTVLRELKEETQLEVEELFATDICETFYGVSKNTIHIAPIFVGYVSAQAEPVLNFEHSDYRWVSLSDAPQMVPYGGQRRALRNIEEDFSMRSPSKFLRITIQ